MLGQILFLQPSMVFPEGQQVGKSWDKMLKSLRKTNGKRGKLRKLTTQLVVVNNYWPLKTPVGHFFVLAFKHLS